MIVMSPRCVAFDEATKPVPCGISVSDEWYAPGEFHCVELVALFQFALPSKAVLSTDALVHTSS